VAQRRPTSFVLNDALEATQPLAVIFDQFPLVGYCAVHPLVGDSAVHVLQGKAKPLLFTQHSGGHSSRKGLGDGGGSDRGQESAVLRFMLGIFGHWCAFFAFENSKCWCFIAACDTSSVDLCCNI
jgi:hypothetical protein